MIYKIKELDVFVYVMKKSQKWLFFVTINTSISVSRSKKQLLVAFLFLIRKT